MLRQTLMEVILGNRGRRVGWWDREEKAAKIRVYYQANSHCRWLKISTAVDGWEPAWAHPGVESVLPERQGSWGIYTPTSISILLRVLHGWHEFPLLLPSQVAAKAFQQRNIGAFPWEAVIWAMGRLLWTSVSGDWKDSFSKVPGPEAAFGESSGALFPEMPPPLNWTFCSPT